MSEQAPTLRLRVLICLALGLITLGVYLPSLRHDFLAYDDQQYVTENRQVQAGLTGSGLIWAFGFRAGNWHPLTWLSHSLDCQLYGLNSAGHHLTNVLLHAANTLLLFLVLCRMTGAMWRSALVAALFGWHPLHVESVAWVAERKDVLCAFFWMLTLWAYSKHVASDARQVTGKKVGFVSGYYWLTLLGFALALMSKPMAVTLPFVLLLLDYWPLQRLQRSSALRLLVEKSPFFALSVAACVLTIFAQQVALVSTAGLTVSQRITHALIAYVHYLCAMFVPRHLAVHYPYEIAIPAAQIIFAGVLLALITMLVLRFARRMPFLVTGWLWYLGTLVPVIGLVQVGDQAWADRYTYLPLIGPFLMVVWGLAELFGTTFGAERRTLRRAAAVALVTVAGVILLAATAVQLGHWKTTRTIFEHTAKVTRNNHMATTMLGSLLAKDGRLDEAIEHYRTALRWRPGYPEAYFFLGNALDQQRKLDEAIAAYRQALWFKPIQEQTHILLGVALGKQKSYDAAMAHYRAALQLNSKSSVAHNNLARVLHTLGRPNEAIEHYSAAVQFDPNLPQARNNLGILLVQNGKPAEGTAQLREALRLDPENKETQYNLAVALNQQSQWREAAELFAKTVGATADPTAHFQFAEALAHLQRTREAMSHYASALLLQGDFPDALNALAWILATDSRAEFRNGAEGVRMAERACELTGRKDFRKLSTLAAACAEAGRFPEAVAAAENALSAAATLGRKDSVHELEAMLTNFRAAKPWRVATPQP